VLDTFFVQNCGMYIGKSMLFRLTKYLSAYNDDTVQNVLCLYLSIGIVNLLSIIPV